MTARLRRVPQLVLGLVLFGFGLGFIVQGGYGQGPWTVFHDGLADHTPLSIGTATIVTGVGLLVATLALGVRIGLGTVANVAIIGPSTDLAIWLIETPDATAARAALTIAGPLVTALGSGLYLGVRLGPGPRDGLMTGLHARGMTIRRARFLIEATAFAVGVVLGGTVGWGTVWWLLAIGPAVQWMLPPFDRGELAR
ncbi:MAG: hypothetical protein R8F63_00120 [Acidimicrobiales bacterium]|nr:hypothetical protein [Acidimicrobiales bacterium]